MILILLIFIPLAGGLLSWFLNRWNSRLTRWVSLSAITADLILVLALWATHYSSVGLSYQGAWLIEINLLWIPQLGINFHLAMDSLSLILVTLTAFLGIMAVVSSWTEVRDQIGFLHLNLMATLAGIIGVFLALDLFLFYFFWELMLVPMYFLIAIWGHENRLYASIKFFIFTQLSGLLMLTAILGLYFIHGKNTGIYTFDYMHLLGTSMTSTTAMWLMLGFLIAFVVKLPVVPVHSWLPDAHTEAPTAGSVILAGLLLKTGAYGLLRFVVPLFPEAAFSFTPVAMVIAVIGILYGAVMAFAQTDLKRLVAYTSISHMGFVFLGIFAWNTLALQGAVMQVVCHGISTGALFILVGALQERIHTREISHMGGLWSAVPRMGAVGLFFALASLGLPGLGNFVAEFLVLIGTYKTNITMTVLATAGLITATVYSLWMIHVTFFGLNKEGWKIPDFSLREMSTMVVMIISLVLLGLYPQPLLNTAEQSLNNLQKIVRDQQTAVAEQETRADLPSDNSRLSQPVQDGRGNP
jgi:NADH-quinone oxidoreductase subunit M